ncbi:MAG: prepilin-type N-terminal cleavage/methylation domain-containing protein [Candidatus Zambryskibacteria bacterium]|nr:prepilin-type N-terminal cleavage/methylation domain-containing protein [Candidatus Zambryskibacteria bacterium]
MDKRGFTIIESLVAITILVAAVIGAMSAAQSGISSYIFSKDQIIAFYLAQEGFEQIRNIRDENRLNNVNWLTGIAANSSNPCYFGSLCTVSPVESAVPSRCSGGAGSCPFLRQDNISGFFGYNGAWTQTVFRREIQTASVNDHEIAITVTVDWSKGLANRQFKAKENILDWQ